MDESITVPLGEETELTEHFYEEWDNKELLEMNRLIYDLEQVAFYDKIHIYQVCGNEKKKTIVFARDENGVYNPTNCEIDESQKKVSHSHFVKKIISFNLFLSLTLTLLKTQQKLKFEQHGRYHMGIATRTLQTCTRSLPTWSGHFLT